MSHFDGAWVPAERVTLVSADAVAVAAPVAARGGERLGGRVLSRRCWVARLRRLPQDVMLAVYDDPFKGAAKGEQKTFAAVSLDHDCHVF